MTLFAEVFTLTRTLADVIPCDKNKDLIPWNLANSREENEGLIKAYIDTKKEISKAR
jgi:hypothetical protein